ncbi:21578_t:CDS:2, partial [Cetraspora pellucida]
KLKTSKENNTSFTNKNHTIYAHATNDLLHVEKEMPVALYNFGRKEQLATISTFIQTANIISMPNKITNLIPSSSLHPDFSTTCENKTQTLADRSLVFPPEPVGVPFRVSKLPSSLNMLLTRTDQRARLFKQNIRMYNSALSFTSLGANIDHSITGTSGVYSFRIHSEMYHSIGSLFSDNDNRPEITQLYIYDTEHELRNRMNIMPGLDPVILGELQQMLHDLNPYCNIFKQAGHMLLANPLLNLRIAITDNRKEDPRRYNTPTALEVAVIMIGDGQNSEPMQCDIILQLCEGPLKRISELHHAYQPLHYVLMFPRESVDAEFFSFDNADQ